MRAMIGACFATVMLTGCYGLGVLGIDRETLKLRYADQGSRFLQVNGLSVHVRAEGEGPAILMLHGLMDSLHAWDDWAKALASCYRVIRIDIPPFGLSDPRPDRDYDPDNLLPVLDEVLDAYGVDSAILMGNSLGGYFSAYYAAHVPQRVLALVLISPAAYPQPLPWELRFVAMPVVGVVFQLITPLPMMRSTLRSLYGEPERLSEEDVRRRFELMRAPGNRRAARHVVRLMAEKADEEPIWIRGIKHPSLLIWGTEDRWVPPELADRWLDDLQEAKLALFSGVGHVAMEEIPEESLLRLRRFLSKLSGEASPAGACQPSP